MTTTTGSMSIRLDTTARENQFIAQKERECAWHESCDAALKHFDETGLHATHDEVMTWMDSWGTDKELPAPACHP